MDDQSVDTATTADASASASTTSSADASASTLTDDHHDWASSFCGIDTRAEAETGGASTATSAATGSSSHSDSGGIWGAIKGAASSVVDTAESVASDVGNTVADAAKGAVNTVETVASDVGHTVADAAGGVVNTVETAAKGVVHTVEDAGSGIVNTAEKVAGDIGSGNFGQALSDTADGVVTTAGHVVSDTAHAIVDTGSAALDAAGKVVTDTQQTVADAATGVIKTAGNVVSDVAHTVGDAAGPDSTIGRAAGAVGDFATTAAGAAVDTVNTITDFNKGVVEGVVGGVEGLAKGVVNLADGVGKEAYALATDEKAREDALNTVEHGAEAVGKFEMTMMTDPGKAMSQVGSAIEGGATTVAHMAENVYDQYQKAAAAGHGAEFIGKGVGQVGVLVAGAVLTDGASLGAEAGAAGAEGAALLVEGAEGAAALSEGAAAAGEAGALASEGAAAAGEAGVATGELATAADEAGTAATQLAERGASAAEDLGEAPTAIPGADPGPLPARFQGPSQPVKLFDTELQPIEPGSPNLTATPKPGEPIPYELGDGPPAGQVQVRPTDGSPVADPLAQTQELPAIAPDASPGGGAIADAETSAADASDTSVVNSGEESGLDADQARQREILEEFEERQQHYGQAEREIDDAPPSPDLEEPNRMEELDQGHDRTWEREDADERVARGQRENPYTPADHRGSWASGNPGDGRWAPHNPGEYGLEEGQTVPFREGVPDFTEYATETPGGHPGTINVEGLTGDSAADRAATIRALAEREGIEPEEMEQWLADNQQRLHHFGGDEMQVVPRRLHELFHQGGAQELRGLADAREMAQQAGEAMADLTAADPAAADAAAEFERAEGMRAADLDPGNADVPEPATQSRVRVATEDGPPTAERAVGPDGSPEAGSPEGVDPKPRVRVRVPEPEPPPGAGALDEQAERELAEYEAQAEQARELKRMRLPNP
ncbi:MAG: hypothetical protein JO047_10680 [Alphaproteobacteria bacterium]|nr:hypothetical protein [Alphaproteobacteria bacterium]